MELVVQVLGVLGMHGLAAGGNHLALGKRDKGKRQCYENLSLTSTRKTQNHSEPQKRDSCWGH